jgi:hypothetical protein
MRMAKSLNYIKFAFQMGKNSTPNSPFSKRPPNKTRSIKSIQMGAILYRAVNSSGHQSKPFYSSNSIDSIVQLIIFW